MTLIQSLLLCAVLLQFCIPVSSCNAARTFKTYWNMPTIQCERYKLGFEKLGQKHNILQNKRDAFAGDQITILYHPGLYPQIGSNEGNLTAHLELLEADINKSIPSVDFSGVGIIDFERWRPIYRQNFGTLTKYRTLSTKIEKEKQPSWERFEKHGRLFMEKSLLLAQKIRPKATWGYYGFPHCFNHDMKDRCSALVEGENNRTKWLFTASDMLNPSVYINKASFTQTQLMNMIKGRVKEAQRLLTTLNDKKLRTVIPYYALVDPQTGKLLPEEDIVNSISTFRELQIDGLIVWGSSASVNTLEKCRNLYKYIDTVFGPALNK
ncbi:hypothetical protein RI129_012911 [Pyrocoelia pectoralis]|uniref:Hyaluronidase n=1 Tax=Pyrocoelia pectoralis TaxID=417401 RepID=A0AAN7ZFF9_9COLE